MKRLPEILGLYQQIDADFELDRGAAEVDRSEQIASRQVLNDQAYFLLCWGQLEVEVDEACRSAIRRRINSPDWQIRRSWELYNPEDRRLSGLSFEDRAKLVLDQREHGRNAFKAAMNHYRIRNEIAHGKLQSVRVDMVAFAHDAYAIQSALKRAV